MTDFSFGNICEYKVPLVVCWSKHFYVFACADSSIQGLKLQPVSIFEMHFAVVVLFKRFLKSYCLTSRVVYTVRTSFTTPKYILVI